MEEWEQVNLPIVYVKPSQLKEGDFVEGIFMGTEIDEKYKKPKHQFKQEDGQTKILNGSGQLDYIMKGINIGDKVKVVFDGKKKLTSGPYKGTEANTWKVYKNKSKMAEGEKVAHTPKGVNELLAKEVAKKRADMSGDFAPGKDILGNDDIPF